MFGFSILQQSRATATSGKPATAGKPTSAVTPTKTLKATTAVGKAATAEIPAIAENPSKKSWESLEETTALRIHQQQARQQDMRTAGTAGNANKSRVPEHVTHGNSSDANIRDTGAETLATVGTPRLTAEKTTATRGATTAE
jgi:hypothetical protein